MNQRFKLGTCLVQLHKQYIGGPVKPIEIVSLWAMNSIPTKSPKTLIPPLLTHYSFIHTQDYLQIYNIYNKIKKKTSEDDENLRVRFPLLSGVALLLSSRPEKKREKDRVS